MFPSLPWKGFTWTGFSATARRKSGFPRPEEPAQHFRLPEGGFSVTILSRSWDLRGLLFEQEEFRFKTLCISSC